MPTPPDELEALKAEVAHLRAAMSKAAPDLEGMLALRGFNIHRKEEDDDLIRPDAVRLDAFYALMKHYPFRIFLRDVIKHQKGFAVKDVAKYATPEVTRQYLDFCMEAGIVERTDKRYGLPRQIKSFGATLEWFVAEIFRPVGGDYDLIARLDCDLLYMEIKSSPPKQTYQSEVEAFLDRVEDLRPAAAMFFMDTELRMKDKLVPMFEEALAKRSESPPPVSRLYRELFHIGAGTFIINAKDSIAGNIRRALGWYYRRHQ
jgi:hypothetical protein